LEIGAGGDLDVAGGEILGDPSKLAQLIGLNDSAGNTQAGHKSILNRGEKEKTIPFEAEDLFFVGSLVGARVFDELRIGVERMEFAFDPLFEGEIFVLCRSRDRLDVAEALASGGETGENAGEVFFLFGGESGRFHL